MLGHSNATPAGEWTGLTCDIAFGACLWVIQSNQDGQSAINGTSSAGLGAGVTGDTNSDDNGATGVFGFVSNLSSADNSVAVRGVNSSVGSNPTGVEGEAGMNGDPTPMASSIGVLGETFLGRGVDGRHYASTGTQPGVRGLTVSTADLGAGVHGEADSNGTLAAGTYGSSTNGIGALGIGGSFGVLGYSPSGLAGYFLGNVHVQGTLSKAAGSFRIDHPLHPADMYLQHSFVESPDMLNVYSGNVSTDVRGFATVTLPRYFDALNRHFRYQLTVLGRSFAQAIIWQEIRGNTFRVRTSQPRVRVSWQVTGVRDDPYARAHPIRPEVMKPEGERGRYLAPELYGKPAVQGLQVQRAVTRAVR